MRLKTYCAGSMAEAIQLVRKDMGRDAIIVATHQDAPGSTVQVTAALEADDGDDALFADWAEPSGHGRAENERDVHDPTGSRQGGAALHRDLGYHGVPAELADRLVRLAMGFPAAEPVMALAGALDEAFTFAPLLDRPPAKPLMLIGPPGAGKTIAAAKLMMRARRAGRPFAAITTDTRRAGGVEQLQAFTAILGAELVAADGREALAAAAQTASAGELYIDTAGANPFDDDELETLRTLVREARAEPLLVLPAGGDAMEIADAARAFASVGARRLIATRLDITRRFGSLLAAAAAGRLSFADVGISPFVADGFAGLNPVSLARLLLPAECAASSVSPAPAASARPIARKAAR
jgi:flagellar biosynthesis protein FlhF